MTSCGDCIHCINLHARELFGYPHGECHIDDTDHPLGRCPEASITTDGYEVTQELIYSDDTLGYFDKNGDYQDIFEINGPYTMLFDYHHSHKGVYATRWLGKTGYDFGEKLYYFKEKEDALLFCLMIERFKPEYLGTNDYVFKNNTY